MKKLMIFALTVLLLAVSCGCAAAGKAESSQIDDIESCLVDLLRAAGNENIVVYDASELTADILENRCGTTVVERCFGVVTDAKQGDGRVLNPADKDYDYIGYRGVYWPVSDGTVLLSYMIYNPDNGYVDDIVERYDFILDIEQGRIDEICMSSGR